MSKRSKNRKLSRQGKIAVQAAALSPPPRQPRQRHPQQVQRTVSLSEDDARIRLTALTLLPGKA